MTPEWLQTGVCQTMVPADIFPPECPLATFPGANELSNCICSDRSAFQDDIPAQYLKSQD